MTRAIRLRRSIVATLILTAIILPAFPVAQASAISRMESDYTYTPKKICQVDWREGTWHVKQLIKCAARHWGVSVDTALYVANRESNYRPRAYNSWSRASGIYQHLAKYWPGRARAFGFRDYSAFNARANIIVTMKMVRRGGWGPWGY